MSSVRESRRDYRTSAIVKTWGQQVGQGGRKALNEALESLMERRGIKMNLNPFRKNKPQHK